jgi:hypothetical protein
MQSKDVAQKTTNASQPQNRLFAVLVKNTHIPFREATQPEQYGERSNLTFCVYDLLAQIFVRQLGVQ